MHCILAFHCKALCIINIVVLYEVELLSYIDHKAAEDYDTFTEVSKMGKSSCNYPSCICYRSKLFSG